MDNNRNGRTRFETDLQDILTNYLNENMGDIINEQPITPNDNTNTNTNDNTNDNTNTNTNTNTNDNTNTNTNTRNVNNYYIINRILDGLSANMIGYHRNYQEYLSLLREILTMIPHPTNYSDSSSHTNNIHQTNRSNNFTSPFTPISTPRRTHSSVPRNPLSNTPISLHNNDRHQIRRNNNDRHQTQVNRQTSDQYDRILTYTINSPDNMTDIFNSIFSNVIIRPTQEEIHRATEDLTYNTNLELDQEHCPISLDEFREGDQILRIRHCGHVFGSLSLHSWFNSNVRCPVCRFDIRDTNIVPNNEQAAYDSSMNAFSEGTTTTDLSSNLAFRLEIPFQYAEIYDESNNLIRRDFY